VLSREFPVQRIFAVLKQILSSQRDRVNALYVGHSLNPCNFLLQAFSAFYFVMDFLNLTSEKVSSQEKMTEIMANFCSRPWEEVSD
jgi:hypothetical protein